jgi:hypothetical protein
MKRQCGECQLCCKLLPVVSLKKVANEKCKFQKFHKGCTVYHSSKMPLECNLWNCRWLVNDDTADLPRPDRCHYVIDIFPDTVYVKDNNTNKEHLLEAVVVWCDPQYPEAHRDPKLREYLMRCGKENKVTMVRYNSQDSVIIFAPSFSKINQWVEVPSKAGLRSKLQETTDRMLAELYEEKNK